MKKLLFLFAATLLCSLAHSQEAEGTGSYAEFQVIPRFEVNPYFTPGKSGDGSSGYSFGNSSIYTLLEGAFSEHVSYVVNNHWLSAYSGEWAETAGLYTGSFYSNTNNWVDLAYLNFSFGNWTFTVGKDCIASGGFEYDAYDVDVDYLSVMDGDEQKILLASNLWYNLPGYQWGAKAAYSIEEHTTLALQMLTSPFGERPFASGLYAYSGKWDGSYGPLSNMWSVSAIQRADRGFEWLVALSQHLELGDFTLGFDWYNMVDVDYGEDGEAPTELIKGNTFRPNLSYAPSDKFDCSAACNVYTRMGGLYALNAGAAVHYYPWEWLQLHAAAGWDMGTSMVSCMAGLKVNLTLFSL